MLRSSVAGTSLSAYGLLSSWSLTRRGLGNAWHSTRSAGRDRILVLNAGSSTLKFKVFTKEASGDLRMETKGAAERIGEGASQISVKHRSGEQMSADKPLESHKEALREIFVELGLQPENFLAVGHRIVQGGDKIFSASQIDAWVRSVIAELIPLAPLHNPVNLLGVDSAEALFGKEVPQVAVFDTAFHQTMPEDVYRYAVPADGDKWHGVRKYGYHGSSYAYLVDRAAELLQGHRGALNAIICHLGAGASMACVEKGKSVDTTMGMTPLDGLVMASRCGDIDPGAVLYLADRIGIQETDTLLNKKSGLFGLAGTKDMRDVVERAKGGDRSAELALAVFVRRVRKHLGAYLVTLLGRVDVLVFSAGVGEHSADVRERICEGLELFGIDVDAERNHGDIVEGEISTDTSRIKVLVIPTDEELQIAKETLAVVEGSSPESP